MVATRQRPLWSSSLFATFSSDAARAIDYCIVHPNNPITMSDYGYMLKQESIALFPAEPRGSSKLLRVDSYGEVSYYNHFGNAIPSLLHGCHVIFNNSRVLDARLSVRLAGTGESTPVELMLLDLGNIDPTSPCNEHVIPAMIRSEFVMIGDTMIEPISGVTIEVVNVSGIWEEEIESGGNGTDCFVRIHSSDGLETFLTNNGSVPIPPYIQRMVVPSDKERYNNVYAKLAGSVAAPTAGLHFTDEVLTLIGETNISKLTLHVGAGTFKPVLSKDAREHSMHAENFSVNVKELKSIIHAMEGGKPLAVVGTTSVRTLESLYWLGVKQLLLRQTAQSDNNTLSQEVYDLGQFDWIALSALAESSHISPTSALRAMIDNMHDDEFVSGKTSLMITPKSYNFKVVDHLITNFHAPDSTLMLLVSAFLSKSNVAKIYEDAQRDGYRFLSYGDVCLFSKPVS
jgi:S-adenosylmethionine:tRNA ribosyltransferase-isomerase